MIVEAELLGEDRASAALFRELLLHLTAREGGGREREVEREGEVRGRGKE